MKTIIGICAVALIVGFIATSITPAQTIAPDQATLRLFPRETTGVAVFDVAALRNTQLFQEYAANPNYPAAIRRLIDATGFQPDKDIDVVTAAKIGKRDYVAVIRARYDRFKVEQ